MMIELQKNDLKIGVISDTHGLLRPEVFTTFSGVDYILHAGDIGDRTILEKLETIAPVLAVAGNTDSPMIFIDLYDNAILKTDFISIYMIHNINNIDLDPFSAGFDAVIYGHSHKPAVQTRNGVLFFNPGSAGPRRFSLPVSVGLLTIKRKEMKAQIVELSISD